MAMPQESYLCSCTYCPGQKWVSAATWHDHNRHMYRDPPVQQPPTISTVHPTDIHMRDAGMDRNRIDSTRRVKEESVDLATIPPMQMPQPRFINFDSSMRPIQSKSKRTAHIIPPPSKHTTQPHARHNANSTSMRPIQYESVTNTVPPSPSMHIPQPYHTPNDVPSMHPVQPQSSTATDDLRLFLQAASEQLLISVGNRAYMELSQENLRLKTGLIATRTQCNDLMNDLRSIQLLNTTATQALTTIPQPISSSQTVINPNPAPEDYPNVKYWYRCDWKRRANLQPQQHEEISITDENACTTLRFITHPDGRPINAPEAYEIRKSCRHIWNTLAAYSQAPDIWSNATDVAVRYFNEQMYLKHPIMRLCADNWKLDQLAKIDYPGWIRNRRNSKHRIQVLKPEPQDEEDTATGVNNVPRLHDNIFDHADYMLAKPQSLQPLSLSSDHVSAASTVSSSSIYTSKTSCSP